MRSTFVGDDEATFTAEGRDIDEATLSLSEVLVFHTSRITPTVVLGFIVVGGLRRVGCL